MSKTVGKTVTAYAWDMAEELPLLLLDRKTIYAYGPGGLAVEQRTGAKTTWLHHDELGSTRLLTGTAGTVTGTYTYGSWGRVVNHTGSAATNLQFDGQYTDEETRYQYLRDRYYDSASGQFLTVDPLLSVTGAPYQFGMNDPANLGDPSGDDAWTFCFGICLGSDSQHGGFGIGIGSPGISYAANDSPLSVGTPDIHDHKISLKPGPTAAVMTYADGTVSASAGVCLLFWCIGPSHSWQVGLSPTCRGTQCTLGYQADMNARMLDALQRKARTLEEQYEVTHDCTLPPQLDKIEQQIYYLRQHQVPDWLVHGG